MFTQAKQDSAEFYITLINVRIDREDENPRRGGKKPGLNKSPTKNNKSQELLAVMPPFFIVFMNDKIQWKYPLKGVTESLLNNVVFNFKVRSRETLTDELKVKLPGLPAELVKETFELDTENILSPASLTT